MKDRVNTIWLKGNSVGIRLLDMGKNLKDHFLV